MNDGVALLLERIKTHPEEFESNVIGKWSHIINSYKQYLEEEDCKALDKAINALMQQRFTEQVMEELVDPKSVSHNDYNPLKDTRLGGATLGRFSGYSVENQMHIDAHIKELKKLKEEKPKTLFGKLFNYQ
jgi:hypothetical protein